MSLITTIPDQGIIRAGNWRTVFPLAVRRKRGQRTKVDLPHQRVVPPGAMIFNSPATVLMRVLAKATRDKRANNIFYCCGGLGRVGKDGKEGGKEVLLGSTRGPLAGVQLVTRCASVRPAPPSHHCVHERMCATQLAPACRTIRGPSNCSSAARSVRPTSRTDESFARKLGTGEIGAICDQHSRG